MGMCISTAAERKLGGAFTVYCLRIRKELHCRGRTKKEKWYSLIIFDFSKILKISRYVTIRAYLQTTLLLLVVQFKVASSYFC